MHKTTFTTDINGTTDSRKVADGPLAMLCALQVHSDFTFRPNQGTRSYNATLSDVGTILKMRGF